MFCSPNIMFHRLCSPSVVHWVVQLTSSRKAILTVAGVSGKRFTRSAQITVSQTDISRERLIFLGIAYMHLTLARFSLQVKQRDTTM